MYSKVIQLYACVCIFSFLYSFVLLFITGYWIYFSVLHNKTLLYIHSVYNNLHLLTPVSHSTPSFPHLTSPLTTEGLFSSVRCFLFHRFMPIYVPHTLLRAPYVRQASSYHRAVHKCSSYAKNTFPSPISFCNSSKLSSNITSVALQLGKIFLFKVLFNRHTNT